MIFFVSNRWIVFLCLVSSTFAKESQRKPERFFHLGGWFPTEEKRLIAKLEELDLEAREKYEADLTGVRALIVPHAGYRYSGAVAASGFRLLDKGKIKRIILLAPSHKMVFEGVAVLDGVSKYILPYGSVAIDTAAVKKLLQKKVVRASSIMLPHNPFDVEHAIEVELPLIHHYLPDVRVVPLIVGGAISPERARSIAKGLEHCIDDSTAVVVSSDFVHYGSRFDFIPFTTHVKERIRALDNEVLQPIFEPSVNNFFAMVKKTQATVCGRLPLMILLALLEKGVLGKVNPFLLAYATSAGGAKEITHSVSYVSLAFAQPKKGEVYLTRYEQNSLLQLARDTIANSFTKRNNHKLLYPLISPSLQERRAAFVTLTKGGQLRGCVGHISAAYPLSKAVHDNALSAALRDQRFNPLESTELSDITIKVSVLTDPVSIKNHTAIQLGKHGIILHAHKKTATFLPSVPVEHKWDIATTLEQLSIKAGLEGNAWKKSTIRLFKTIDFSE